MKIDKIKDKNDLPASVQMLAGGMTGVVKFDKPTHLY